LIHSLLEWLSSIGLVGLFITMFIEGSSIPFPGIVVVLAYGYLMPVNIYETILIALGMSLFYSIASIIPYTIAYKLESVLPKRLKSGIERAKKWFGKYGVWSIALTRPFGVGNYISYVAGVTKVKPIRFILLTFIGIFPWALGMLIIGSDTVPVIKQIFNG
jgi:membrane protein DedA with SNARE-associated domain